MMYDSHSKTQSSPVSFHLVDAIVMYTSNICSVRCANMALGMTYSNISYLVPGAKMHWLYYTRYAAVARDLLAEGACLRLITRKMCPLMAPLQPSKLLDGAVNAPWRIPGSRQGTAHTKINVSSLESRSRAKTGPSSDVPGTGYRVPWYLLWDVCGGRSRKKATYHSVPKYK